MTQRNLSGDPQPGEPARRPAEAAIDVAGLTKRYRKMTVVDGMSFGMLLLVSAAAIVLYYVVPNGWDLLFSAVSGLKKLAPWVDLNTAQRPLYPHETTADDWARYGSACAVWVLLPLLLGIIRVRRSEVH